MTGIRVLSPLLTPPPSFAVRPCDTAPAPADASGPAPANDELFHVVKCGLAGLAALGLFAAAASPAHAIPEPPSVSMSVPNDVGARVTQFSAWSRGDFQVPFIPSPEVHGSSLLPPADGFPSRPVTEHGVRVAASDQASNVVTPLRTAEDMGGRVVSRASSFAGQRSGALLGRLPYFEGAGGASNNCADFVSAILQSEGILRVHHNYAPSLESQLRHEGWMRVSSAKAQPGDVWFSPDRGHVEIVAEHGGQVLIGSNNNGRHFQTISHGTPYGGGVYYHRSAH